jgi:hypothetical protein
VSGLFTRRAQCANDRTAGQFDFEGVVPVRPGALYQKIRRLTESGLGGLLSTEGLFRCRDSPWFQRHTAESDPGIANAIVRPEVNQGGDGDQREGV